MVALLRSECSKATMLHSRRRPPPGSRATCCASAQTRNRYAVLPGATSWIFSGLAFIRPHSGS